MRALWLVAMMLGISSCMAFPVWRDQALQNVAEGRGHAEPAQVHGGIGPSQTTEFYGASGKHVGYGKVQSGTAEFYGVDGSRIGFGRK